jgi:NADH-quinone oxidoreductase subunit L
LWRYGDVTIIDGLMVNGTAKLIGWFAGVVRSIQSGYIYHYAISMLIGVLMLMWAGIFLMR